MADEAHAEIQEAILRLTEIQEGQRDMLQRIVTIQEQQAARIDKVEDAHVVLAEAIRYLADRIGASH